MYLTRRSKYLAAPNSNDKIENREFAKTIKFRLIDLKFKATTIGDLAEILLHKFTCQHIHKPKFIVIDPTLLQLQQNDEISQV